MADYATTAGVQMIVNKAVDDLSEIIQTFAQSMDSRFNKVEADIAGLKSDVKELNNKYDHLMETLDAFFKTAR